MKLRADAVIAGEKITAYLLRWRPENDKSQFLGLAGYTAEDTERLGGDIRAQLLPPAVEFVETTEYGDKYRINGTLTGPNGRTVRVQSIWMTETATGVTKFITLYPLNEN